MRATLVMSERSLVSAGRIGPMPDSGFVIAQMSLHVAREYLELGSPLPVFSQVLENGVEGARDVSAGGRSFRDRKDIGKPDGRRNQRQEGPSQGERSGEVPFAAAVRDCKRCHQPCNGDGGTRRPCSFSRCAAVKSPKRILVTVA